MTTAAIDLAPLQPLLRQYDGRARDALLPLLHEAQTLYGWLPRPVLEAISHTLRVPLADIHGVVEFYTMFYNEPTAKRVIRLCEDPACHLANGQAVAAAIGAQLGLHHGETAADGSVSYEHVPCLGMCELAPVALNGRQPAAHLTPENAADFLAGTLPEPTANIYGEPLWMSARIGKVDPGSLADYEAHGGYQAIPQALAMSPEALIRFVESVDVVGRGGAMFPTGRKWRMTRLADGRPDQKHIVVNADESEPGTFKDRCLLEEDPFSLIEAMTIAAYAVGASNGWVFLRGEYPRAYDRLIAAVRQAREAGYLGQELFGVQGFNFDVEIRLGAGAYICGEETALFEAIEGKRGFPRIKPPFPVTHGLFGQPTAVNNVETLAAVLAALNVGVDNGAASARPIRPAQNGFALAAMWLVPACTSCRLV
jgi:NADH-quinone oxidoreductase subunit F